MIRALEAYKYLHLAARTENGTLSNKTCIIVVIHAIPLNYDHFSNLFAPIPLRKLIISYTIDRETWADENVDDY